MIHIRPIHLRRDLPDILTIEEASFGKDAFPVSEFLYLYMRGKELFLVAHNQYSCIGYISAYQDANQAYIASIAVDENFRRRGIGQLLIKAIIERLSVSGDIESLNLHVRQSNQAAISLYQSLEFIVSGVELDYYLDEDAYIMRLALR